MEMFSILEEKSAIQERIEAIEQSEPRRPRRQTCVVCGMSYHNMYMTVFTNRPEKRSRWIEILSNGDADFESKLNERLAHSRRYVCYDHFPREQLLPRPNGNLEVTRHSNPEPYIAETFVRMKYQAFRPLPIHRPKQKEIDQPSESSKIPEEMTVRMISVLMNAANHYIEEAMKETQKQCE